MSSEENQGLVLRLLEILNQHDDLNKLDEVCEATIVDHGAPPGTPANLDGYKQTMAMLRTAFPNIHYTVEDLIADGDRVVFRTHMSGTHRGLFLCRIPPTGQHFMMQAIHIFRIANGKLAEHWAARDDLGMLQQLGVIPQPQPPATT